MNILVVSHERNVHGATRSLISMIQGFKKKQNVNIIVLLSGKGTAAQELKKYGIKYYIMPYCDNFKKNNQKNKKKIKNCTKEVINICAVLRLSLLLKKWEIDIVHSNSSAVDIGARAASLLKINHIYHIREFMEEDFGFTYRKHRRMKQLIENSIYVIFISNIIRDKYITKYKIKNYSVIYNGFIIEEYYEQRTDLLTKNNVNMLLAGTISKNKGVEYAIETVRYLKEKNINNIKLYIIGEGSKDYLEEINRCLKKWKLVEDVKIGGYQDNLSKIRKKMDIALMCSHKEAFGRVTVEAMLAGLLVIGKNEGGTLEIVKDSVNGVLYCEDINFDLGRKLESILENKEVYVRIAEQGQMYAKHNYDNVQQSQKISVLYKEIMSRKYN